MIAVSGTETIEAIADDAWLLQLGDRIDPLVNARVHALAARVRARAPTWLRDLVPAYASLGVFFDPAIASAADVREWLASQLDIATREDTVERTIEPTARVVEIPVIYGGEHGPDLEPSAAELGLSAEELVARHVAGNYTVAMIGFAPGFPYLLGLDPELALPRLASPRTHVPAGSVGIGGAQTGIYPNESPGGWRLIGRTPLALFDPTRESPALLTPGDCVRFVPLPAR
ncbi:5-oxoprolinase subunit PxpB [Lysobacter fragariae]